MDPSRLSVPRLSHGLLVIRVHEFGGPEVLKLEDVAIPKPSGGEVLVRIHAARGQSLRHLHARGHLGIEANTSLHSRIGWRRNC